MKRVKFKQTLPLPSYLMSFAVGPFGVVDAGKAGKTERRSASSRCVDTNRKPPMQPRRPDSFCHFWKTTLGFPIRMKSSIKSRCPDSAARWSIRADYLRTGTYSNSTVGRNGAGASCVCFCRCA